MRDARDIAAFQQSLDAAFRTFDWAAADRLVTELADRFRREPNAVTRKEAAGLLNQLRRKRRFSSVDEVLNAFPAGVANDWTVRRQRAQSLIEQGNYAAAEDIVLQIADECPDDHREFAEAKGLLGRIYKQRYVNANRNGGPFRSTRTDLDRAISEYAVPWRQNAVRNYWHGINVVACVDRGRRDKMGLKTDLDTLAITREVLDRLESRERADPTLDLDAWEHATALECLVALIVAGAPEAPEAHQKLRARAMAYVLADRADAFEINSTHRQLLEVWQLTEAAPPGSDVLPVLRAALLTRVGGSVNLTPGEASAARHAASELTENSIARSNFQEGGRPKPRLGRTWKRSFKAAAFWVLKAGGWAWSAAPASRGSKPVMAGVSVLAGL